MTVLASGLGEFSAGVSVHHAMLTPPDAENAKCPIAFLPAGNDSPLDDIKAVLDKKPFGQQCEYHMFSEMKHGWVPRGDEKDPAIARDIVKAFLLIKEYFSKFL